MKSKWTLILLSAVLVLPASAVELTKRQSGRIAFIVGRILSFQHLRQRALDNSLSQIFLKDYLNALDVNHMVFLQSDVEEFRKKYATKLDDITLGDRDASPAFVIFDRYISRLVDRRKLVDRLLETRFDFTKDESIQLKRSDQPWPRNDQEAGKLWHRRIKYDCLQGRLQKEDRATTVKRLKKRYDRVLKNMRELESDEILQIYLTALTNAYDPHSDYMSQSEAENFRIQNVDLSLEGIGALLRSDEGYCKIVSLVPGGPAALSKNIQPNDRIISVAQGDAEPVDVVEMKLSRVVQLIRGKRGTTVRLEIIPNDVADTSATKWVRLVRDKIQLKEQLAKARIIEIEEDTGTTRRLGVVELPQYYKNASKDVEKLLERLGKEAVEGLILDLRNNGGGILDEAIKLTGLFFDRGPVVQVKDYRGHTRVLRDTDSSILYDGPLIVLVNHLSASASEITAAALQDYGRALIVGGQSTHGKGTVQTLIELEEYVRSAPKNSGMLKYTISNFYRIAGGTTQKYGVTPDIILPSIYDHMELGEAHLENSLEPDRIAPLNYRSRHRVKSYLSRLITASEKRVAADPDFAYLRDDIQRYEILRKREKISLNEAVRNKEKEEDKKRQDARDAERKSRKQEKETIYLLTIDQVNEGEPLRLVGGTGQGRGDQLASIAGKLRESIPLSPEAPPEESRETQLEKTVDPHLRETLHILRDYIDLSKGGQS